MGLGISVDDPVISYVKILHKYLTIGQKKRWLIGIVFLRLQCVIQSYPYIEIPKFGWKITTLRYYININFFRFYTIFLI